MVSLVKLIGCSDKREFYCERRFDDIDGCITYLAVVDPPSMSSKSFEGGLTMTTGGWAGGWT